MNKINIVAEIGWNWMDDMGLAKRMIKEASQNGATYVKTQVFDEKYLKPGPWDEDGRREIYKKAQPTYDQLVEMKQYCKECGVKFLASCMSVRDAELYAKVTTEAIKIPGFESRNKKMLEFAFDNFDTIIMSTGTSSVKEIVDILSTFKKNEYKKLVLLHCVSAYPCLPEYANLERINEFKLFFASNFPSLSMEERNKKVGYSDHIQGVESAKVALEYDIGWIEKHFTIDRSLPGRDNKFAILPEELKNLTDYIQLREKMKINLGDNFLECEKEVRKIQPGRFAIDE